MIDFEDWHSPTSHGWWSIYGRSLNGFEFDGKKVEKLAIDPFEERSYSVLFIYQLLPKTVNKKKSFFVCKNVNQDLECFV